jgi:hypothetical protein
VTFILKLFVAIPLFMMAIWVINLFQDRPHTPSDFKVERVKYSKANTRTYGVSRRYKAIEIIGEGKSYTLYSREELIPEGMTLEQVADLLTRSSEATIWVDEDENRNVVNGIQTEYLNIPPSQGVEFHKGQRSALLWGAVGWLGLSLVAYFYFKKYYDLDWKLNFKTVVLRPRKSPGY